MMPGLCFEIDPGHVFMRKSSFITLITLLTSILLMPVASAASQVIMETSMGTIVLELNEQKAPKTVENFLDYVRDDFYEGTVFHRVIDGFMIQGGGFTQDFQQKPTRAPILNEADNGLKNTRGTIAMARTADPHSATAQFFINVTDNPFLDHPNPDGWGYTVFGRVVEGMDVVDAIARVPTTSRQGHQNVPVESVVIENVEVRE
jgi:cyclophilin family peptidyl-prolyl cis-trans isomerase